MGLLLVGISYIHFFVHNQPNSHAYGFITNNPEIEVLTLAVLGGLALLLVSRYKRNKQVEEIKPHQHSWEFQYFTGNPNKGQSDVNKCECGKWAVRHYGKSEFIILKDN